MPTADNSWILLASEFYDADNVVDKGPIIAMNKRDKSVENRMRSAPTFLPNQIDYSLVKPPSNHRAQSNREELHAIHC